LPDADVDGKTVFDLSKPSPRARPFTWGEASFTLPQGVTVRTLEWTDYSEGVRHEKLIIANSLSVIEFDTTVGSLVRYEVAPEDEQAFRGIRVALEAVR
jgi:hypothetical protein